MGSDIEHQQTHDEVRVIAEFGDVEDGTSYVEHGMAREIMRLRSILAAIREPSEAFIDTVVRFGYSHFHGMPIQPANFLRAAVAAAEQEVGDE